MPFLGRGTVAEFLFFKLYFTRNSWQLLHSKLGTVLPNVQVIMEIQGVVNNPIIELRFGEEKPLLEEWQQWTVYWSVHAILPPLSHQAFAGPLPTEWKALPSAPSKQWLWISSLRPGTASYWYSSKGSTMQMGAPLKQHLMPLKSQQQDMTQCAWMAPTHLTVMGTRRLLYV